MKQEKVTQMNYAVYVRKSSDSEDRQVLSIDSQIDELKALAERMGLNLETLDIRPETRSAKMLGRPVWNGIMDEIKKGKLNGIIAWQANRLSRNSVDTGEMIYLMDLIKLAEVVTPSQTFRNTPNDKLMLNFFCSVAKFENDNKGIDAKRGLEKKARAGWIPNGAKPGYMNDPLAPKGAKTIKTDPIRLPIVKEAWKFLLTGSYTPPQILKILNGNLGYRSPKRGKLGGKPMARSQIYTMFRDTFYYGPFEFPLGSGNWYNGQHETIITEDEFWKAQEILGRKGRPQPHRYVFTYAGTMYCGECDATITVEKKIKKQKNGNEHLYIYYHCTHRKITIECTQGVIEVKELEKQILTRLGEVEIPQEFHDFAMEWMEKENRKEIHNSQDIARNLEKELEKQTATINGLIDMRARDEVDDESYRGRLTAAKAEKTRLEEVLVNLKGKNGEKDEPARDGMIFVQHAKKKFTEGTPEIKKGIFLALGSNRTLKDKKLSINVEETLLPVIKVSQTVKAIHDNVRTAKKPINKRDWEEIYSQNPTVLPN